jgi:excisionase family DNA binding protein
MTIITHRPGLNGAAAREQLLTVPQVMQRLQLSRAHVYRLMQQGRLKSTTVGRARRVKESMLNEYCRSLPNLMSHPRPKY